MVVTAREMKYGRSAMRVVCKAGSVPSSKMPRNTAYVRWASADSSHCHDEAIDPCWDVLLAASGSVSSVGLVAARHLVAGRRGEREGRTALKGDVLKHERIGLVLLLLPRAQFVCI